MRKALLLISLFILFSCKTISPNAPPKDEILAPSTITSRTLVLNGDEFEGDIVNNAKKWRCKEKYSDSGVLVEVGKIQQDDAAMFFVDEVADNMGFVLYDGGDSGILAMYQRAGLNHRWDFDDEYAFVIKPDGTGLYYDFTMTEKGETTGARQFYECQRYK